MPTPTCVLFHINFIVASSRSYLSMLNCARTLPIPLARCVYRRGRHHGVGELSDFRRWCRTVPQRVRTPASFNCQCYALRAVGPLRSTAARTHLAQ
jgi:hypothetical protein